MLATRLLPGLPAFLSGIPYQGIPLTFRFVGCPDTTILTTSRYIAPQGVRFRSTYYTPYTSPLRALRMEMFNTTRPCHGLRLRPFNASYALACALYPPFRVAPAF